MRKPMPSPRGTNIERAYLNPGAAYDAAMPDDVEPEEIVEFLSDKLEDDDLATVKKMLGMGDEDDASGASDAAFRSAYRAQHPEFRHYHAQAREMHRIGVIGDRELKKRLTAHSVPRLSAVASTNSAFPHANRLKI